jgi:riboflavin biosynthesis pyrimidine reductase
MRRLLPVPADPSALADREWSLDELADAYAYPPGEDVWLRANMVSSVDGAAAFDGRSQPLSSPADMRLFGVLRALADVVVVGAETVRLEGYRPARVREAFAARRAVAGQTTAPPVAVLTASFDLDFSLPLFTAAAVPTLLLTGAQAPAERVAAARAAGAEVVVAGEGRGADPAAAVAALAERGHRRLLTEGGPSVLGRFARAGVLDELCLTLAPRVALGDGPRIMHGTASAAEPLGLGLESVMEEAGFLFTRYRRF